MAAKNKNNTKKNKFVGIMLVVIANVFLSAAISQIMISYNIHYNQGEIIDSLQNYSENQAQGASKQASETLKKFDAEIKAGTNDPFAGNPNGKKILTEFFDYNCGYCKHTLPEIVKLIGRDNEVKVVFKELPILGPSSELASKAALAIHAKQPEKYFPFHKKLMEYKQEKTEEVIIQLAQQVGVNFDLKKEMENPEYKNIIDANRLLAQSLGINGTPSFVVNGLLVPGAVDADSLEKLLSGKAE